MRCEENAQARAFSVQGVLDTACGWIRRLAGVSTMLAFRAPGRFSGTFNFIPTGDAFP